SRLVAFEYSPWPKWTWQLPNGSTIEQELFAPHGHSAVAMRWRAKRGAGLRLRVRPFLSGRDLHALHYENPAASPATEGDGELLRWRPYPSLPAVVSQSNATFRPDPLWFRNFLLSEERARGFEHREDLLSPGELSWDLGAGEAVWILSADGLGMPLPAARGAEQLWRSLRQTELRRREAFATPLHRAADAYVVKRGEGSTIIAGYPWFADWGRDTFIALRGIALVGDRLSDARDILLQWAGVVSQGMLPNRFLEAGDQPEFNSVDASLWYIIAVHEFRERMVKAGKRLSAADQRTFDEPTQAILEGYTAGTRYGIHVEDDGLLACGAPGVQLTWMDAKVGDWVVTPRRGKPVEVQALWLNALRIGSETSPRWSRMFEKGMVSFGQRFWDPEQLQLADVIDVEGRAGERDLSCRPNQIFAVAGLPFPLLQGMQARAVVDAVEYRLLTPLGLRSLAPGEPGYAPHYAGGPVERDGAYHQGTVWPWLAGPFVEAWIKVRGNTAAARGEARRRFLTPLLAHLEVAGLGHVSEVADAEPPHTPGGCPFQAWSVGELLRLSIDILGATETPATKRSVVKAAK
ncbi:MAG TPA: amylo-alpha-1,6-glucosidase, partial [Gemmatimonadales bacterium]|nr:amylo-alpha-1,6-glucosidase [Gemmatimonadales bacterium]